MCYVWVNLKCKHMTGELLVHVEADARVPYKAAVNVSTHSFPIQRLSLRVPEFNPCRNMTTPFIRNARKPLETRVSSSVTLTAAL